MNTKLRMKGNILNNCNLLKNNSQKTKLEYKSQKDPYGLTSNYEKICFTYRCIKARQ